MLTWTVRGLETLDANCWGSGSGGLLFSALYVVSLTVLVHDISIASMSVSCGEFSPMVMRDNLSVGVDHKVNLRTALAGTELTQ